MSRLLLVALLTLTPTLAHAGPKEPAADENPANGKLCGSAESDLKGALDGAWKSETAHDVFVTACNHNPSAPKLFQGSTPNAIPRLATAYCEFRPALRLCLVCRILTKASTDLRSAANDCSGEFRDRERATFNSQVLEIPAEPIATPDSAPADAR